MGKLFYSMAGEGRGHATRVRSIVESLRHEHEIALFASGAAYELLEAAYAGTEVEINRIPGLFFHYNDRKVSIWKTTRAAVGYIARLPGLIRRMQRRIEAEKPDVVITDFEPSLARAARRAGVPFISLDHQHFLIANDLSSLPWRLRWKAWFLACVVARYYGGQAETIVSSFYFPPLKKGYEHVTQIGSLLRPEVLAAERVHGEHLLVYLRRFAPPMVMDALARSGRDVRIYGLGERPTEGNITFHPVSEDAFLHDLATCDALISNAGNQLVGEALYLHKPVLVFPEAKNSEQYINAHFLKEGGGGDWFEPHAFTPDDLRGFLAKLDDYRAAIDPERIKGNDIALDVVRRYLAESPERTNSPDPVRRGDPLETVGA